MIILWVVLGIWAAGPVCCLFYLLPLLLRDLSFCGFERWYCLRFELISNHSPYAKAWKKWHGVGLWGYMITRRAGGKGVLHELAHVRQWMALGGYFMLVYVLCSLFIWLFLADRHAYYDNPLERAARKSADQMVDIPSHLWPEGEHDRWPWW